MIFWPLILGIKDKERLKYYQESENIRKKNNPEEKQEKKTQRKKRLECNGY